jgi:hypothetical protein
MLNPLLRRSTSSSSHSPTLTLRLNLTTPPRTPPHLPPPKTIPALDRYSSEIAFADVLLVAMQEFYYRTVPASFNLSFLADVETFPPLLLREKKHFLKAVDMSNEKQRVGNRDMGTLEAEFEYGVMKLTDLTERAKKTFAEY